MSFLFPAFLLGAVTIAIPVVLHLMRRERAPVVPFSAVRFVRRSATLRTRRLRLRELLLLALRVTALLLLTVAFARPFVDDAAPARAVTVVAVDRSLSMSAPGQMEEARRLAAAAVEAAPAGHRVAVVAFDDRATVVLDPTDDRAAAIAAVESVTATSGATRYGAALAAASGLAGTRSGRIVVVTDLQEAGWPDGGGAVARAGAVEVAAVAAVPANLAVTAVGRTRDGLSVVVGNAGPEARDALVALRLDDAVVENRVVALAPGANAVRFERPLPESGVASVEVVDPDGYAGDNRRYLLLDPPSPVRLLVIVNRDRGGSEAFFIERALAAGSETARFLLRVTAPDAVAALDAGAWETLAAVLILGTDGLAAEDRARLAAFVAAGGGLLVAAGAGVDPASLAGVLGPDTRIAFEPGPGAGRRRWVPADRRHPLLRALGGAATALGEVTFRGAATIAEGGDSRALGRFDDGTPALVEYDLGTGRVLLFASDLSGAWNDFPRRPGFAPFVHETVRYVARVPDGAPDIAVADVPRGVPATAGAAIAPDSGRRVVVNVDPRESAPAPMTAAAFLARVDSGAAAGGAAADEAGPVEREREQAYWWYALAAMLAVLVAEAWLARAVA